MNHKCASHVYYCLVRALCLGILVLCTDTKKTLKLSFFLKIPPENISSEDYNITVKVFGICIILLPYLFLKKTTPLLSLLL